MSGTFSKRCCSDYRTGEEEYRRCGLNEWWIRGITATTSKHSDVNLFIPEHRALWIPESYEVLEATVIKALPLWFSGGDQLMRGLSSFCFKDWGSAAAAGSLPDEEEPGESHRCRAHNADSAAAPTPNWGPVTNKYSLKAWKEAAGMRQSLKPTHLTPDAPPKRTSLDCKTNQPWDHVMDWTGPFACSHQSAIRHKQKFAAKKVRIYWGDGTTPRVTSELMLKDPAPCPASREWIIQGKNH